MIFKRIFLVKKLTKNHNFTTKNEKTYKIAINISSKTVKNQKKGGV